MARVTPIGQPVNDSERVAIAHLRDHLSDAYTVLHNFELTQGAEIFEIDLIILAPHCVFVVDVKGTRGLIDVHGAKWYPEGRQPYHSPLAKLRQHARALKTLICDAHPERRELRRIHVHAAVLMTSPDAQVVDPEGRDGPDITYLNKCVAYFQTKGHIPADRSSDIRSLSSLIERAIRGKARPRSAPPCYRDWQVEEKLGGNDRYTEYRAKHTFMGQRGGTARLRVYRIDPYQDDAAHEAERRRISTAFRAVAHMPGHPNILAVREFFETEERDCLVLVAEDIPGQALQQHIKKPSLALTFDQKLRVMQDVLHALAHAHACGVIHRNLTPDAILVSADSQARLAAFDYARVGEHRTSTIAHDIIDDLDPAFQAPECYRDPAQASMASDLFSAGLVFYLLLTGEPAFSSSEQMVDQGAIFPVKPSDLKPDLPAGLDAWLQTLCVFDPAARFSNATAALHELNALMAPVPREQPAEAEQSTPASTPLDLFNLSRDTVLAGRFVVQERLGSPGGFAVAYKVFDTFGDVVRVLKLVTRDRRSVFERLRREYATLTHVPPHPHVAQVIWAERLPDETPCLIFEYVDGLDVAQLLADRAFSLEDAVTLARQAAEGLTHLHAHGVYHQDIKPSNLLWTDHGVRIIDFNVAVSDWYSDAAGGGTRRYIPPDLDPTLELSTAEKIDRDLYALGITFYECVTGRYPFDEPSPPAHKAPHDPRDVQGCEDISPELVTLLLKSIAPRRPDRFPSAAAFCEALQSLPTLRKARAQLPPTTEQWLPLITGAAARPNFNPYVSHLLTLYSQSQHTNAGTRGLDTIGEATYVSTLLDGRLCPEVLAGTFGLVLISGNAGDGKTAFIQQVERQAERAGAALQRGANGTSFTLHGRTFLTNYDGSQDEGETTNDEVLLTFLRPFMGTTARHWPTHATRVLAINEGRLIDFLAEHAQDFPYLTTLVRNGLQGSESTDGVLVINLNLRSVVTDPAGGADSIFERLMRRLTDTRLWEPCTRCDLQTRCYIIHNARTFMDPVAGPKVIERFKMLYTIAHLRGRLHITLRDVRSALAFMLVGTRDCDGVHELYHTGGPEALHTILDGFYFNAWIGGSQGSADRLLTLLRDIDVGATSNPELDRLFDWQPPETRDLSRLTLTERGTYDDALLTKAFEELPRAYDTDTTRQRTTLHRNYVAMLRRRYYFERRDEGWRAMLPYRSVRHFLALVAGGEADLSTETQALLLAMNRGEGLADPLQLGNVLALRVRQVASGTIRSYRLFDGSAFTLVRPMDPERLCFVEHLPQALRLRHSAAAGPHAELVVTLDVYEMLTRLNNGYRPSIEELQGLYRNLAAFKNVLASAPYHDILLTETGHEFYRMSRDGSGKLALARVQEGALS